MNSSLINARARAHGRPKPGAIPSGDRLLYPADEGQTS
jgi:hypothetical protein